MANFSSVLNDIVAQMNSKETEEAKARDRRYDNYIRDKQWRITNQRQRDAIDQKEATNKAIFDMSNTDDAYDPKIDYSTMSTFSQKKQADKQAKLQAQFLKDMIDTSQYKAGGITDAVGTDTQVAKDLQKSANVLTKSLDIKETKDAKNRPVYTDKATELAKELYEEYATDQAVDSEGRTYSFIPEDKRTAYNTVLDTALKDKLGDNYKTYKEAMNYQEKVGNDLVNTEAFKANALEMTEQAAQKFVSDGGLMDEIVTGAVTTARAADMKNRQADFKADTLKYSKKYDEIEKELKKVEEKKIKAKASKYGVASGGSNVLKRQPASEDEKYNIANNVLNTDVEDTEVLYNAVKLGMGIDPANLDAPKDLTVEEYKFMLEVGKIPYRWYQDNPFGTERDVDDSTAKAAYIAKAIEKSRTKKGNILSNFYSKREAALNKELKDLKVPTAPDTTREARAKELDIALGNISKFKPSQGKVVGVDTSDNITKDMFNKADAPSNAKPTKSTKVNAAYSSISEAMDARDAGKLSQDEFMKLLKVKRKEALNISPVEPIVTGNVGTVIGNDLLSVMTKQYKKESP